MEEEGEHWYRAVESRDGRFDGWIYQPQARASPGTDLEAGWGALLEASDN